MKLKFNSNRIPVAGWVDTDNNLAMMMVLQTIKYKDQKFIFTSIKSLDENSLYVYLFFHKCHKNLLDTAFIGKVKALCSSVENRGGIAYEFNVEKEVVVNSIIRWKHDDEPESITLQAKNLAKRKKMKNK